MTHPNAAVGKSYLPLQQQKVLRFIRVQVSQAGHSCVRVPGRREEILLVILLVFIHLYKCFSGVKSSSTSKQIRKFKYILIFNCQRLMISCFQAKNKPINSRVNCIRILALNVTTHTKEGSLDSRNVRGSLIITFFLSKASTNNIAMQWSQKKWLPAQNQTCLALLLHLYYQIT